jgi:AcrR family transcriptional regulator
MSDTSDAVKLITAALRIAAERGWSSVSVALAAREAGVGLAWARGEFPSRASILLALGRSADQAALAEPPDQGSTRDRLFDLLMRRIDALQTHRAGIVAVLRGLPADPATALTLACATRRSMRWMLDTVGVPTSGLFGELRVRGLVAVWLWTIRAWERDESEDMGATMAALDTALTRAESLAHWLDARGGPPAGPNVEEPGAEAAG